MKQTATMIETWRGSNAWFGEAGFLGEEGECRRHSAFAVIVREGGRSSVCYQGWVLRP